MGIIYYLSSAEIIIFLSNMDFKEVDIRYFLKESIPFHFKALNPLVFKDFISYLFQEDGFKILPAQASPAYAEIITAEKRGKVHLIYPVHKNNDQPVDSEIIEKAGEVMDELEAQYFWVITNVGFTEEGRSLADETGIELWDWDALYTALSALFYEGKDPMEEIKAQPGPIIPEEIEPYLRMKVKWEATEGVGTEWYNLGITLSNPTERNIYLHLDLPALIDPRKNQIMADHWGKGEFIAGMLYGGASIRTNALFSAVRLGERPSGGRIVLTCHERQEPPVTYHLNARLKGQACFVVTYCYSTYSPEYEVMTRYRDHVLAKTFTGRQFISLYYFFSSRIVAGAAKISWLDKLVRKLGGVIIPFLVSRVQSKHSITK